MDPITSASAFATIISLLGQFRSERDGSKQGDFNGFLAWLTETHHDELKNLVEANTKTTIGIKALLNDHQDVLITKLESLDHALASFASSIEGFSELGQGLKPEASLSEQAINILRQFESSGASKIIELHMTQEGVILIFADGKGGQLEIADQRFIQDDLKTLVELNLLRQDFNSKGDNMYLFTRIASQLVHAMGIG